MDSPVHVRTGEWYLGIGAEGWAMDYSKIITIEPGKMGGKPCIRGLRITVYDVLDYLASGMTEGEILHDFPDVTGVALVLRSLLTASANSPASLRETAFRREPVAGSFPRCWRTVTASLSTSVT